MLIDGFFLAMFPTRLFHILWTDNGSFRGLISAFFPPFCIFAADADDNDEEEEEQKDDDDD